MPSQDCTLRQERIHECWSDFSNAALLPANTFVLFRRVLQLAGKPQSARGWIFGESRYLLEVNGRRIQWGPAPFDPRWPEIDPLDLTDVLAAGDNAIGATVLFYGHGDGTWPLGRPGVTVEAPAGTTCELITQEAHVVGGRALLNTTIHKWARFTCRDGVNRFQ